MVSRRQGQLKSTEKPFIAHIWLLKCILLSELIEWSLLGRPWWSSGQDLSFHCGGHGFAPWLGLPKALASAGFRRASSWTLAKGSGGGPALATPGPPAGPSLCDAMPPPTDIPTVVGCLLSHPGHPGIPGPRPFPLLPVWGAEGLKAAVHIIHAAQPGEWVGPQT